MGEIGDILPDLLKPGLKVVFCGTAAGNRSAEVRAYYAGRGNKFWSILYKIGMTDKQLLPEKFRELLYFGIGLTDLAKLCSGSDSSLPKNAFDCLALTKKLMTFAPKSLAFNGKNAGQAFLNRKIATYGVQKEQVGSTVIYVLPSTSGAANGEWVRHSLAWERFADDIRN